MKSKYTGLISLFIALTLFLSACQGAALTPPPTADANAISTSVAATIISGLTQSANEAVVAQLTAQAAFTATTAPTNTPPAVTPSPTSTLLETATASATIVFPPSATPPLFITSTPLAGVPTNTPLSGGSSGGVTAACLKAEFVRDVTVPDNTPFNPGDEFEKVWRLRNSGTCTWSDEFQLVSVSGNRMGGDRSSDINDTVRPGDSIDLGLDLVAPDEEGRYTGYWMLESENGTRFGIGSTGRDAFYVSIRVLSSTGGFVGSLAGTACNARWSSGAGTLSCPGRLGSNDGAVVITSRPILENGRTEDEPTIIVQPDRDEDGYISGRFPDYVVKDGDRFVADVGCLADSRRCQLVYEVSYRLQGSNQTVRLGSWEEESDGNITRINIDLSFLAGEEINLILTVYNDGDEDHANGFWLSPQIRK